MSAPLVSDSPIPGEASRSNYPTGKKKKKKKKIVIIINQTMLEKSTLDIFSDVVNSRLTNTYVRRTPPFNGVGPCRLIFIFIKLHSN